MWQTKVWAHHALQCSANCSSSSGRTLFAVAVELRLPVVVVGEVTLPGPLDLFLPVGEVGEANTGDDFARVGEEEKLGGKS